MKALKIGNLARRGGLLFKAIKCHSVMVCRFRTLLPRDLEERSGSRERGGSVRKRHGMAWHGNAYYSP